MPTPILMAHYHEAVLSALREISWVTDADDYPETVTQLATPAVYFSIIGWKNVPSGDGQLRVEFEHDLFVVVDRSATADISKPQIYVRTAAADLSQWIEGQTFGLEGLEPAQFVSADPDEFDPEMAAYIVWRITFTQVAAMGEDPFESKAGPLKKVFLGKAPNIGSAHVDDYRLIYEKKEGAGDE
ncbi:hypothetical protein [Serratia liquefaciens]|uniref:hypothetical protein n=1 Tax=Serratia liquefaciens TaxID=614 RepID=UPI003523B88D